jgi:hypothetical protein
MVLMEIHTIFENRKNSMLQILKNQEKSIALEKKQELKGAVNEIELFLKTLEFYSNNNSVRKEAPLTNLMKDTDKDDDDRKGFFSRFDGFFKRK